MATAEDAPRTAHLVRLVLSLLATLLLLLIVGLIGAGVVYLSQHDAFNRTYALGVRFPDAEQVKPGSPVTLAGLPVGTVGRMRLDGQQADVQLVIKDGTRIPRGSQFLAVPALVSPPNGSIKVVPPAAGALSLADYVRPNEADLVGQPAADPALAVAQTSALLQQLSQISRETAPRVGTLLDQATQTTRGLNTTVHSVNAVLANQKTQHDLTQAVASLSTVAANSVRMTDQLNAMLAEARPEARTTMRNVADTTGRIRAATQASRPQIAGILSDLKSTTGAVSGIVTKTTKLLQTPPALRYMADVTGDLKSILDSTKTTSQNLSTLTSNSAKLSSDPQIQGDLKATLHNLAQITDKTQTLLDALTKAAAAKK